MTDPPCVSIVFLAYNRREKLATSLEAMRSRSDYPRDRIELIVVDNGSSDGTAAMVRADLPDVQLLERDRNGGVSAFNDGFARARGEYVLALDDDCYLPPDGLRRAVAAAREHDADMVSFAVGTGGDDAFRFGDDYPTGLLAFWGCAVLARREVLEQLGGYDPEIFLWANELEFTLRFLDAGFRHLHLPEVVATHMKERPTATGFDARPYRYNARHFAYIAAKLLRARDLPEVALALFAQHLLNAVRVDRGALGGVRPWAGGLAHGLRHRDPVRPEVSRLYRRNFHSFAVPTAYLRTPSLWRSGHRSRERPWRRDRFIAARGEYYPDRATVLKV